MALRMAGGPLDNSQADGYHDSNEVDRTTMEGQVTKLGERISWTTDHDIVRGEVIEDATAESDVAEGVWQAEYLAAFGVIFLGRLVYDCHQHFFACGPVDRGATCSWL